MAEELNSPRSVEDLPVSRLDCKQPVPASHVVPAMLQRSTRDISETNLYGILNKFVDMCICQLLGYKD